MRSAGFGKCLIQETHRMQKRMAGFYILPAIRFLCCHASEEAAGGRFCRCEEIPCYAFWLIVLL